LRPINASRLPASGDSGVRGAYDLAGVFVVTAIVAAIGLTMGQRDNPKLRWDRSSA
jgi:hypothetical protein